MSPYSELRELLLVSLLRRMWRTESKGTITVSQRIWNRRQSKAVPLRWLRSLNDPTGSILVPAKLRTVHVTDEFFDGSRRRIVRRQYRRLLLYAKEKDHCHRLYYSSCCHFNYNISYRVIMIMALHKKMLMVVNAKYLGLLKMSFFMKEFNWDGNKN